MGVSYNDARVTKIWRPGMELPEYAALWEDMLPHYAHLTGLALRSHRIAEFGVRGGVSSWAFLSGLGPLGELHSVDIDPNVQTMVPPPVRDDPRWNLIIDDSRKTMLPIGFDVLLIDSSHTLEDTRAELRIGLSAGVKTIVLHDYLDRAYPGVHEAVHEVMRHTDNYDFELYLSVYASRWGLAVLTRKD